MRGIFGRYTGVGLAAVGAAVGIFISIWQITRIPVSSFEAALTYLGIGGVSLFCGIMINSVAALDVRRLQLNQRSTEKDLRVLRDRLMPLHFSNLDEYLQRRAEELFSKERSEGHALQIFVHMQLVENYHVVASTVESASHVRRISLSPREGTLGVTLERRAAIVAESALSGADGDVYSTMGEHIAVQNPLAESNKAKCNVNLKWIYCAPIFESPGSKPWSDRVLGVISADSHSDDGKNLFLSKYFQSRINTLAIELAPMLAAIEVLISSSTIELLDSISQ